MPYKIPQSKVKARMAREVAAKHNQLSQLKREHSSLLFQHTLLSATCELLQWIRSLYLPDNPSNPPGQHNDISSDNSCSSIATAEDSSLGNNNIYQDEQTLLEQLDALRCCSLDGSSSPSSTTGSKAAAPAAAATVLSLGTARDGSSERADPSLVRSISGSSSGSNSSSCNMYMVPDSCQAALEDSSPTGEVAEAGPQVPFLHQTIAPEHDALLMYKRLLAHPQPLGFESLQKLQEDHTTTVCELSLNLAALEQPQLQASCCAEHPAAVIKRLVIRHFHQLVSLALMKRNDLVLTFYVTNCLTGEVGEGVHKDALSRVVQQLQLTPRQIQRISDGEALFKRLLAPVIQARQQLQVTGFSPTAEPAATAASSNSGSTETQPSSYTAVQPGAFDGFPERTSALQRQQRKVANLSTLMKKEFFLKACLTCFSLGCLTWFQAAQLLVLTFPFPPPMAAFSQAVAQHWLSQQQQQQSASGCRKQH